MRNSSTRFPDLTTSGSQQFDGIIDDISHFEVALTPTEVQSLYDSGRGFTVCKTSATLSDNEWSHIAVNFNDSANTAEVFVNGTSECSLTGLSGTTYSGSTEDLTIGDDAAGAAPWDGAIGEFRFTPAIQPVWLTPISLTRPPPMGLLSCNNEYGDVVGWD